MSDYNDESFDDSFDSDSDSDQRNGRTGADQDYLQKFRSPNSQAMFTGGGGGGGGGMEVPAFRKDLQLLTGAGGVRGQFESLSDPDDWRLVVRVECMEDH